MSFLLFLLDVRPDPVSEMSWVPLILLLGIVLILSIGFAGGLAFLLIWLKRLKQNQPSSPNQL